MRGTKQYAANLLIRQLKLFPAIRSNLFISSVRVRLQSKYREEEIKRISTAIWAKALLVLDNLLIANWFV